MIKIFFTKNNLEQKIPNTRKNTIYMILEDLTFRNKLVHGEKVDQN